MPLPNYKRSIIRTLDDDFVMIDRLAKGFDDLVVICHGLEGSSFSNYIKSLAPTLHKHGYDVLCINFRSCGGVINRRLQMYHSGDTSDLHMVLKYHQDAYKSIHLIGFSLGGNVVLKYLGQEPEKVHHKVRNGVAVSVPVDLASSAERLTRWDNVLYSKMFLKSLKEKVKTKFKQYPEKVDVDKLSKVKNVLDFDEYYTGPIHGFEGAQDYYNQSNALQFLDQIQHNTLLINAKDDPFLTPSCYPEDIARNSEHFHLLMTEYGGHVGFMQKNDLPFHEKVILNFIRDKAKLN